MSKQERHFYSFGPFRLDVTEGLLLRDGESLALPPKAFETLLALVESSGHLLSKKDLMNRLWPDAFVEEANLANNISLLRKVLDDGRPDCKYIETVPKRGYRFVAPVEKLAEEESEKQIYSELSHDIRERISRPLVSGARKRMLPTLMACALLAVGAGYYSYRVRTAPRPSAQLRPPMKSIAVLPFKSLVDTSRDEVLELGLADTLITRISSLKRIDVRPIGAVRRYTALEYDPVAIGREQQVDVVLDGSIQKFGEKLRVSVRLMRVSDGMTLLANQFDENYVDLFAVQDAISRRVAEVLVTQLTGAEQEALLRHYTNNIEAYQLYLKGRYFWSKFTADGLDKSIEYFNQALEEDPNYALAYLGLASSYVVLGVNYRPPREVMPRARACVLKALELDRALADAYGSQGGIKYFFDWDWSGAESEFKRGMELGPSDRASAHELYGYYLWAMGRLDEATAAMKRAQELDPLSLAISDDLGVAYYYSRDFDRAIEQQQKTLDLDPNYFFAYWRRAQAYLQKGMFNEAIGDLNKSLALSGNWPGAVAELGCAYAMAGQKAKARAVLNELRTRTLREYIDPYLIAIVHTSIGDKDAAFEWLGKAYEERSPWLTWLKVEPKFDRLRTDPRFEGLLGQVGLP